MVVVNDAETGVATFGQLADFVALVALARVDLSALYGVDISGLRPRKQISNMMFQSLLPE